MAILSILKYLLFSVVIYGIFAMSGNYKLVKAIVPVYRYYNLFNFYHYRVYKRDYSKIYIIFFLVFLIGEIVFAILGYNSDTMLTNLVKTGDINKVLYYKVLFFETLSNMIYDFFELLILYPLAKKYSHKIIVISIYVLFSMYDYILKYYYSYKIFHLIKLNDKEMNLVEIKEQIINLKQYNNIVSVGYLFATLFILYICYSYYKKWKKGQDVIVEKIRDEQFNNDKKIFKKRNYSIYD